MGSRLGIQGAAPSSPAGTGHREALLARGAEGPPGNAPQRRQPLIPMENAPGAGNRERLRAGKRSRPAARAQKPLSAEHRRLSVPSLSPLPFNNRPLLSPHVSLRAFAPPAPAAHPSPGAAPGATCSFPPSFSRTPDVFIFIAGLFSFYFFSFFFFFPLVCEADSSFPCPGSRG